MGGVPTCSLCLFWAFKLAVLGNCYNTYVAKVLVSLWKCDFGTLDWLKLEEHFFLPVFLNLHFVLKMSGNIIIDIIL